MLQTLQEHHIYAKFIKYNFYQENIQYLGHIISEDGMAVNPKKIKAIVEFPKATNV
jgi:hypothetical protein